jgi:uncharacterized membrane protein/protein-disulfide isomerase
MAADVRPRSHLWGLGVFLPILVGLAGSVALLVDYARTSPVFCAEGGGCDAVKHTPLAAPLGLPMPLFGLIGFAALAITLLLRGQAFRTLHAILALLAASIGVGLILAQFAMGQYCVYCMSVDTAAVLGAGCAVWRYKFEWDLAKGTPRVVAGALLAFVPAAVAILGFVAKTRLPAVIAREIQRAPKGYATIVEFVDFECPFCRDEYGDLAPMLEASKEKVHVVRKFVPLTRIHPHALDAAKAACCGEALGKGDAMADALFRAPVEELTASGCERIARDVGLDMTEYGACIADPKTAEHLASDRADFDRTAAKGDGLPLLWIGEKKLMGAQDPEALRHAIDQAITKAGS